MTQIDLTWGIQPHPWTQEPQITSLLGSHFLLELSLRCACLQSCLCFLLGFHVHLCSYPVSWVDFSEIWCNSFLILRACLLLLLTGPYKLYLSSVFFYFPLSGNTEAWYQQLALSTMVMACVEVTLLTANLPSGKSFISLVSDIRRLNV